MMIRKGIQKESSRKAYLSSYLVEDSKAYVNHVEGAPLLLTQRNNEGSVYYG